MALVNGRRDSALALNDRGLLYGDGLFETIAVQRGIPCHWDRHLRRLLNGCQRLAIRTPDASLLRDESTALCAGVERAVLKIIITRGQGGRGYKPYGQGPPTRVLLRDSWPDYPGHYRDQGIVATRCQMRLARNVRLAGIKHLNRLEQVLARGEWQDEYQEGLLLDTDDRVVEGTMSNVFIIQNDALHTPELNHAGVAGIMRERILACAAEMGLAAYIRQLMLSDIQTAQAVFFCNSLIGIWPVRRLDRQVFGEHRLVWELMRRFDLL